MFYSRRPPLKAILLSVATTAGTLVLCQAGAADKTSSSSTQSPHSMGIQAFVKDVKKSEKSFSVQMEIENQRKNTIYIAPVSTRSPGGGNTAMTASGKQFMLTNGGNGFVGMDACYIWNQPFPSAISLCTQSLEIEKMTAIEPMGRAILGVTYDGPGDPGAFASFAFKFIVREASAAHSDAASLKNDKPVATGAPSLVTLGFSMLQFPDSN